MAASSAAPANRPYPPNERPDRDEARHPPDPELEGRLDALLADPIVQLLMKRDGVERDVLLRMAQKVRRRTAGAREGRDDTSSD